MNAARKHYLARRYRHLTSQYDRRLDQYSCGRELAEAIDQNLYRWRMDVEAVEAEVRAAIAKVESEAKRER